MRFSVSRDGSSDTIEDPVPTRAYGRRKGRRDGEGRGSEDVRTGAVGMVDTDVDGGGGSRIER